jgi:hypothetical protein
MMLTAAMPLFFLELAFGQFASQGPVKAFDAIPFCRGEQTTNDGSTSHERDRLVHLHSVIILIFLLNFMMFDLPKE